MDHLPTESLKVKGYLIVRADGSHRTTVRWPNLRRDEVAFPLNVTIPNTWGRLQYNLPVNITLPDAPEPVVQVGEPVLADEGAE